MNRSNLRAQQDRIQSSRFGTSTEKPPASVGVASPPALVVALRVVQAAWYLRLIMKSADWLELDVDERIDLVEDIWDSIAAVPARVRLADWQREELDRRLQQYHRDPSAGSPWNVVRQRITSSR